MSDLDDLDLRPRDPDPEEFDSTFDPTAEPAARPRASGIPPALPVAGLVLLTIGLYFLLRPGAPESVPSGPSAAAPAPAATVESAPTPAPVRVELPPLDKSDAVIRAWIAALSANPRLAAWLIPDQLIRKFVAAVENIADDEDPMAHLRHLAPATRFQAAGEGGSLFADPKDARRFDGFARVAESIDAHAAARLVLNLRPLFDEAYAELGHPEGGFDKTFDRALARLLATPVSPGRIEVVRRLKSFAFADPRLQALAPAQKALLRMGLDNRAKVQGKLEEFRDALDAARSGGEVSAAAGDRPAR